MSIIFTDDGIMTLVKPEASKARWESCVKEIFFSNTTDVRLVQSLKASMSIIFTDDGIMTLVKLEASKAPWESCVKEIFFSNTTDVRLVQSLKASEPIDPH